MKSVGSFVVACVFSLAAGSIMARESVAFVEAHPDDLAGHLGTALKLSETYDVHVIDFTHGELGLGWANFSNGVAKATRIAEETAVCTKAGFKLHWCDAIDGMAYADEKVCRQLAGILREINPRAVFCHWPVDTHVDHAMSAIATQQAIRLAKISPERYFHEQDIQSRDFRVAYYVDVSPYVEKKAELTRLYVCQKGDAIAVRKAESSRTYGRNSSLPTAEVFGAVRGTVKPGQGVFDNLPGVVR